MGQIEASLTEGRGCTTNLIALNLSDFVFDLALGGDIASLPRAGIALFGDRYRGG